MSMDHHMTNHVFLYLLFLGHVELKQAQFHRSGSIWKKPVDEAQKVTTKGIRATIKAPINDKPIDKAQKATAMIFIRKHIHDALQTKYLTEDDPLTLWLALADCFNHQKDIYLPEARHDRQHLRFQDFKSVNKYNFEVCRI
ncbi:hypothetical protein ACFXTH_008545 [Malus domestica]